MVIPPESYQDIVHRYVEEHQTSTVIASVYGISCHTILRILRQNYVTIRDKNKQRTAVIPKDELEDLYVRQHLNSVEIGKQYGLASPTVIRLLRKYGIHVRGSHDGLSHKDTIQCTELPSIILNPRRVQIRGSRQIIGEVQCPICQQFRTLTINTPRIKELVAHNGRCGACATRTLAIMLDIDRIKQLYDVDHWTITQLAKEFGASTTVIRRHMREHSIPIRTKGESHVLVYRKRHPNKGTVENPALGDIRRGTEVGTNDNSYYAFVQCPICNRTRWQGQSHLKREGPTCKECAVDPRIANRGTLQSPQVGDIQKGKDIGRPARYYKRVLCPECKTERWEPKSHALKPHLCLDCGHRIMGINHRGPLSSGWRGGTSKQEYPYEFNRKLKEKILQRDEYSCQICGIHISEKVLSCHHIDYDKNNIDERNLISLCAGMKGKTSCHLRTNSNRKFWQEYLSKLVIARYYTSGKKKSRKRIREAS